MKHIQEELPRDRKSLLKLVLDWGWKTETTARNHIKITNRTGQFIYMSGTPSDYRALEKLRSDLKRLGLPAHPPLKEDKPLTEPKLVVSKVEGDSVKPVSAPVAKKPRKNHGEVQITIAEILRRLDKPEGITAAEIFPPLYEKLPDYTMKKLTVALSNMAMRNRIVRVSHGRYRAAPEKSVVAVTAGTEPDDAAILEEVLAVLAKLEGVVKRLQEKNRRIEEAKAALAAIK